MTVLVDINLPPSWVPLLSPHGVAAVHWSAIGAVSARDREILSWARHHGAVVLTHDLDFAAILAATGEDSPSVIQVRAQDLLADWVLPAVVRALTVHSAVLAAGALLSIDESGTRVRILPIRR